MKVKDIMTGEAKFCDLNASLAEAGWIAIPHSYCHADISIGNI